MQPEAVPHELSDEKPIEAVYRRLPGATTAEWEKLWPQLNADLYGRALRFLRNKEDAQDAASTTVGEAYRFRERLATADSARAYCLTILWSVCLKMSGKIKRRAEVPLEPVTNTIALSAESPLMTLALQEFTNTLSETKRTIFILKLKGYEPQEIATKIGTTAGVVSQRLSEIRKAWRATRQGIKT